MLSFTYKKWALLVLTVFMLFMSACNTGTKTPEQASSSSTTVKADSTVTTESEQPKVEDPFFKYDPPITVTCAKRVGTQFIEGEDDENNRWTQEILDKLGIKLKYSWFVSGDQYDAKVNVSIASGDIPDAMYVTMNQLNMMKESDLILDISDLVQKYASPVLKNIIKGDEVLYKHSLVDGKLYGLSTPPSKDNVAPVLFIRKDWLERLNLSAPKTADDLIKIAEAFTKNDPDGNGKNDTIGFGFNNAFTTAAGIADVGAFFNMYHAYKGVWIKDTSGNLVNGSIQPEMKVALQSLRDMYANGLLDQEFAVKSADKVFQDVTGEKLGIIFGVFWNPAWPLQDLRNKNNKADWICSPVPSFDDKQALVTANLKPGQQVVISSKAKNPEAVIRVANLVAEYYYGAADKTSYWQGIEQSEKYKKIGGQMLGYTIFYYEPPTINSDLYVEATAVADAKDLSLAKTALGKSQAEQILGFLNGNQLDWGIYKLRYGKESAMAVARVPQDNNGFMYNEFYGVPGPITAEKSPTLDQMEIETFTKIIMGETPVSEFDKFVEQWKKAGGDEITAEVNSWYAKNK